MTLCISACAPTRTVRTFRLEAVTESVRVTPCTSARTQRKTATTSPMTNAVIPVDIFRATRLRMLYFSGMAISHHLPQAVDDAAARGVDRGHESGQDPDADRDAEGHRERLRRDPEVHEPDRDRRLVSARQERGGEDVVRDEHPQNASEKRHHDRLRQDEPQDVVAAEAERPHDRD